MGRVGQRPGPALKETIIDAQSIQQLISAFTAVFFIMGLGFVIQRIYPLSEATLKQLSDLVVHFLLPIFLFYTMATGVTLESLRVAPALIVLGVCIEVGSYLIGTLLLKPARVSEAQRPVFRFAVMLPNSGFLAFPVCEALFGAEGLIYAVLHNFGLLFVVFTLGIWELSGGRQANWRSVFLNPLFIGMALGLLVALTGWSFPMWLDQPFQMVGDMVLPLALLVGGILVGNINLADGAGPRQLAGVITGRLILTPLLAGLVLVLIGWRDLAAAAALMQVATPVGVSISIMAKTYRVDAEFAASTILWSTLVSILTLPLVAFILIAWFQL